jgi:heptosyltransferase I
MFSMRLAIVKLSAIGDIVHAMVVLQFIKDRHPNSSIDWFVDHSLRQVLENNPHINKIQTIRLAEAKKKKSLKLLVEEIFKLRKLKKYDVVIDLQNLIKSGIISRLIPSKRTIGLDRNSSREKLASVFYNQKFIVDHSSNVIVRNATIINQALDCNITKRDLYEKKPFLFYKKDLNLDYLLSKKLNVAIIPGASYLAKTYPPSSYAKIIEKMNCNFILTWGNDTEHLLAQEIKSLSPKTHLIDKITLNDLKLLLSKVDLVIGGDTGPVHMAWALGVPSITIFGPTPGYRNTFETDINKIIESDSNVNPNKIDKNDYSIKDIEVENVVAKAMELLI